MEDMQDTPTIIQNIEETIETVEEEETIEYFDIVIVVPNGTVVSLTVGVDEVVQDVKQSLLETVETCFLTCYHLEFEGEVLFDHVSIVDIPGVSAGVTWVMVEDDYCVRSSRFHVLRCVDLFDVVEGEKGVFRDLVKDKNLDEGVREGDVGDEAKFGAFFPTSRKRDTCLKSIGFSGWNPVPNYRKLQGDLFYLDVTTLENITVNVTSNAEGFFVNKSNGNNFDPTIKDDRLFAKSLPQLLIKISNNFSVNFSKLLTQNLDTLALDNVYLPLPKTNWATKPEKHSFNMSRSERALSEIHTVEHNVLAGKTREWNKEIQSVKELDNDSTDARINKIRETFRVNSDFIEEAIKGAVEIVDGNVPPFNPSDNKLSEMYLYNNIFFSYAVDGRTYYPDLEPERFAYKKASNDLLGVKEFNSINFKEIHTLGTVIVDYRGFRLVAQSIIPGLFDEVVEEEEDNSTRIKYGSLDTKVIQCDEEFDTLMAQAAEKLHIKKRTVVSEDNEVTLHAHADIKGIEGSDSRKYILDVNRLTPRDANYPNPETHSTAILRPELIPQYIYHLTTEKRNSIDDEELKAQVELVTIAFNTDLLTDIKLVETESTAEELADLNSIAAYLKDTVITKFVDDCTSFNISLSDGDNLKEALHNRGINLRYLGTIATLAEGNSRFLYRLCLVEMICRTAKHIFDSILREVQLHEVAKTIIKLLNCFFSRQSTSSRPSKSGVNVSENEELSHNTMWKEIRGNIQSNYQFTLPDSIPAFIFQLPVLRNICKRNGFQLFAKTIDFTKSQPFSVDLLSSVFPTYKHCVVASGDGHTYLETGKTYLLSRRYDIAFECFQESLAIFHQTYGPMHRAVAECYGWMARILSLFDNPNEALEHQEKAVIIYERVLGLDHSETAQAYLLLASFTYDMDPALALNYYKRALYLQTLIGANVSPEISSTLLLVGTIKQETGDKSAEGYYLRALESSKDIFGENSVATARMYHQLAAFSSAKGDFREALTFEQKNFEILQASVKEDDYNLIESSIWMKQLSESAISPPKKIGRKTRTKKETNESDWEREIISQLPAQDLVNYISNPNVGSSSSFAKWAQKKQNRKANVLKKTTQETTEETISLVKKANTNGKRKRRRNKK